MGNQDIGHEGSDCKVGIAEERDGLGEFVNQFARYEDALSGTDSVWGQEFITVCRDVLFHGEACLDLLCDIHAAGMKVAESWIIHVSVI